MTKAAFLTTLLLVFVCLLPHSAYAGIAGAAGPIVPGQRIGGIRLQDSEASVISRLGKPAGQDMAMGREICVWNLFKADNPTRFDVLLFRSESDNQLHVTELRVNSNAYRVTDGVAVGDTLHQVKRQYPDVEKRHLEAQNLDVYDSVDRGIAFEVDGSGKVTAVIVHASGKESTISAVTLP